MTDKIDQKYKEIITSKIPSGRLGEPEDIANAVPFHLLASLITLMEKHCMLMGACIWLDKIGF